ncbi:MAG TPA: CAP domain-containing protein [Nocardioidaceae bacterium]|nr:CAP domain-containing protein [Nocardioidaceae bacterium]
MPTYEKRVQRWVNHMRENRGLRALRGTRCAKNAAARWSVHLAESERFYHQSMRVVLDRCDATYAGETLARGAVGARRLVRMWMDSPSHRAILLSAKANRIGVGATVDADGCWVVVADFVRI